MAAARSQRGVAEVTASLHAELQEHGIQRECDASFTATAAGEFLSPSLHSSGSFTAPTALRST